MAGFSQELWRDGHRLRKAVGVGHLFRSVISVWEMVLTLKTCFLTCKTKVERHLVCSQRKFPKPSGKSLLAISIAR